MTFPTLVYSAYRKTRRSSTKSAETVYWTHYVCLVVIKIIDSECEDYPTRSSYCTVRAVCFHSRYCIQYSYVRSQIPPRTHRNYFSRPIHDGANHGQVSQFQNPCHIVSSCINCKLCLNYSLKSGMCTCPWHYRMEEPRVAVASIHPDVALCC